MESECEVGKATRQSRRGLVLKPEDRGRAKGSLNVTTMVQKLLEDPNSRPLVKPAVFDGAAYPALGT